MAEPARAGEGRARIAWANGQMPVLGLLRERFARDTPLAGLRIALCLHVTAETGVLAQTLRAGGADVAVCASNPHSTQDEIAAAMAEDGIVVRAIRGDLTDQTEVLIGWGPQLTVDDGADLLLAAHLAEHPLMGATEETTTGLLRIRALAAAGQLRCPVLAVNEARVERLVTDRHGTGQSVVDGVLRATGLLLAGRAVVVLGYGETGKGVADRARGLGAQVLVCEVDPIRALEARMEGFEVLPALAAAARGDVFITVTGSRAVLRAEHYERMRDGAVLANAGHFDVEIDLPALRALAVDVRQALPLVEAHELADGRQLHLVASGRVVNLAAARGHPAGVMDTSFALQALAAERLATGDLAAGVHDVPDELDRAVAALKLASLGVEIDALTPEQQDYLRSWA